MSGNVWGAWLFFAIEEGLLSIANACLWGELEMRIWLEMIYSDGKTTFKVVSHEL